MCLLHRRCRPIQRFTGISLWLGWALLVSGCSQGDLLTTPSFVGDNPSACDSENWFLAPHAEKLPRAAQVSAVLDIDEQTAIRNLQFWAFSDDTRLICLPSVDHAELPVAEMAESEPPAELLGQLLPPVDCQWDLPPVEEAPPEGVAAAPELPLADEVSCPSEPWSPPPPDDELALVAPETFSEVPSTDECEFDSQDDLAVTLEDSATPPRRVIEMPVYDGLSVEEGQLLELIKSETLGATTGALTDDRLEQQCRERIAAAYSLSQRGAVYAARQQLIDVLRKISQAKDSRDGSRVRTESLAAGLRALEEAGDFAPQGAQLEGEMNLEIVCTAHRTPLARKLDVAAMLPSQMTERYNRYAQIKLAVSVAGEPAGSMALYALGKLNSQLGATEADQNPHATRRAVAFQQAALLAHNENYLAAHELGVLLAETGHYPEARHLLLQVAVEQPNVVVFRNLARVHEALGNADEARLCQVEADQLARYGQGPRPQVAWVSPNDFSREQMNTFSPRMASNSSTPATVWR